MVAYFWAWVALTAAADALPPAFVALSAAAAALFPAAVALVPAVFL